MQFLAAIIAAKIIEIAGMSNTRDGDTALTLAQERELRLDGKNAERAAAFVLRQIDVLRPTSH